MYKDLQAITDLDKNILSQIEHFFISYNEQEGKKFVTRGWANAIEAWKIIKDGR
jgi:inorganic pyrophosphatase